MTDQEKSGRAISLLTVIIILVLNAASMIGAVAVVLRTYPAAPDAPSEAAIESQATERISLEKQYEVAIHEAGHAVLGHLVMPERPILRIWLYTVKLEKGEYLGMTEPGEMSTSYPDGVAERSNVLFFLGGAASEQLLLGNKPPDRYEDKDVADDEMLSYCEKVGCECPAASKVGAECLLADMMRVERDRLYVQAVRCLAANKETIVLLANQLFRKEDALVQPTNVLKPASERRRALEADELKTFFEAHPLAPCPE